MFIFKRSDLLLARYFENIYPGLLNVVEQLESSKKVRCCVLETYDAD